MDNAVWTVVSGECGIGLHLESLEGVTTAIEDVFDAPVANCSVTRARIFALHYLGNIAPNHVSPSGVTPRLRKALF